MKKTFELVHPKIKLARRIDAVKHEVKKHVKRERNKTLPEDVDFWDFDCKFGNTAQEAKVVHLSEISKLIDQAHTQDLTSFYIEILVKNGYRRQEESEQEVDSEQEESE